MPALARKRRFVSYRRSDREPDWADQWYVASQIWADVALLQAQGQISVPLPQLPSRPTEQVPERTDPESICHIEKAFVFLDRLWGDSEGGYYPRSNPFGTEVMRAERFGDDNALAGLALIARLGTTRDASQQARYRHAIRREASFLRESGLWDETFGGGFWWNTSHETVGESKPAQTNALAALFFARAFEVTGRSGRSRAGHCGLCGGWILSSSTPSWCSIDGVSGLMMPTMRRASR